MKKYKIVFSQLARKDLNNIHNFVSGISSKENADLVISRIARKIMSLDLFPERTEPLGKDKNGTPIRITISSKYRITYIVGTKENEVIIARIISIGQDSDKQIFSS